MSWMAGGRGGPSELKFLTGILDENADVEGSLLEPYLEPFRHVESRKRLGDTRGRRGKLTGFMAEATFLYKSNEIYIYLTLFIRV